VTGASSGIGEAMVRQLAAAGVRTVAVARRSDRLEALARDHATVEPLVADLTDPAGVARVAARLDAAAPVELLVNNAGFGTTGHVEQIDPDRSAAEIGLNVAALVRLTQAALAGWRGGDGYVLNVSSVASYQAAPNLAVYAATKAFVTSFTEALHEEMRGTGVRVTLLCPGLTRTEFSQVSSGTTGTAVGGPSLAWLSAERVAAEGLDAVARGRAVVVPGALYKSLVGLSQVSPRALGRSVARLANDRRLRPVGDG